MQDATGKTRGYARPTIQNFRPDLIGWMYLDGVTQSAGPKRKNRRHRYGRALTIALGLGALALLVFGRGVIR